MVIQLWLGGLLLLHIQLVFSVHLEHILILLAVLRVYHAPLGNISIVPAVLRVYRVRLAFSTMYMHL